MTKLETIEVSSINERYLVSTSKGNQRKWVIGDKWIKEDFSGYEGIAEELCSKVISLSDLPEELKVPYYACDIKDLDKGTITTGCYSYDFTDGLTDITLYSILSDNNITTTRGIINEDFDKSLGNFISKVNELTGIDNTDYIKKYLAIDALLVNEDRHLNNFLYIIDNDGNVKPSPYFDFGLSLLSDMNDYGRIHTVKSQLSKMSTKLFRIRNLRLLKEYDYEPFLSYDKLQLFIRECDEAKYGRALDVLRVSALLNKDSKIFYENYKSDKYNISKGISTDFRTKD